MPSEKTILQEAEYGGEEAMDDSQNSKEYQDVIISQTKYTFLIVMNCVSHGKNGNDIGSDESDLAYVECAVLETATSKIKEVRRFYSDGSIPSNPLSPDMEQEDCAEKGSTSPNKCEQSIHTMIKEIYHFAESLILDPSASGIVSTVPEDAICLITDGPAPLRQCFHTEVGRKESFLSSSERQSIEAMCKLFSCYFDIRKSYADYLKTSPSSGDTQPLLDDVIDDIKISDNNDLTSGESSVVAPMEKETKYVTQLTKFLLEKGYRFTQPEQIYHGYENGICSQDKNANKETVIRARGLPWQSSDQDIANFFKGLNISKGGIALCLSPQGRRNGEAFVKFEDSENRDLALKRHKHHMGSRYIEVYRANVEDFYRVATGSNNEVRAFLSTGAEMIIRMRGLPYDATHQTIFKFFATPQTNKRDDVAPTSPTKSARSDEDDNLKEPTIGSSVTDPGAKVVTETGAESLNDLEIIPSGILFVKKGDGRPTGDAFVLFDTEVDGKRALVKHRQCIGTRYIELFRSTTAEVQQVLNRSTLTDQRLPKQHFTNVVNGTINYVSNHHQSIPNPGFHHANTFNNLIMIPANGHVTNGDVGQSFAYPPPPHVTGPQSPYAHYTVTGPLGAQYYGHSNTNGCSNPPPHQLFHDPNSSSPTGTVPTMYVPVLTHPGAVFENGGTVHSGTSSPTDGSGSGNEQYGRNETAFLVPGFDDAPHLPVGFTHLGAHHQRLTDSEYRTSLQCRPYTLTANGMPISCLSEEQVTTSPIGALGTGSGNRTFNLPLVPLTVPTSPIQHSHLGPTSPLTVLRGGHLATSPLNFRPTDFGTVTRGTLKECVRLRGLPFEAKVEHVLEFLGDHSKSIIYQGVHMIFNAQGQPSGESFIQMKDEQSAQQTAISCHNKYMRYGKKQRYIEVFQCSGDDMNSILAGGGPNRTNIPFMNPITFIPTLTSPHMLNGNGVHQIPMNPYHHQQQLLTTDWRNFIPEVSPTLNGSFTTEDFRHNYRSHGSTYPILTGAGTRNTLFVNSAADPYPSPPLSPSDTDTGPNDSSFDQAETGPDQTTDDSYYVDRCETGNLKSSGGGCAKNGYDVDVKGAKIISIRGLREGITKDELIQLFRGHPEIHPDMIEIKESTNEARIIIPATTDVDLNDSGLRNIISTACDDYRSSHTSENVKVIDFGRTLSRSLNSQTPGTTSLDGTDESFVTANGYTPPDCRRKFGTSQHRTLKTLNAPLGPTLTLDAPNGLSY